MCLIMNHQFAADYKLLSAPNTTLAPHIAYFTHEAMEKRFEIVIKKH